MSDASAKEYPADVEHSVKLSSVQENTTSELAEFIARMGPRRQAQLSGPHERKTDSVLGGSRDSSAERHDHTAWICQILLGYPIQLHVVSNKRVNGSLKILISQDKVLSFPEFMATFGLRKSRYISTS